MTQQYINILMGVIGTLAILISTLPTVVVAFQTTTHQHRQYATIATSSLSLSSSPSSSLSLSPYHINHYRGRTRRRSHPTFGANGSGSSSSSSSSSIIGSYCNSLTTATSRSRSSHRHNQRSLSSFCLTTKADDDDEKNSMAKTKRFQCPQCIQSAIDKFKARPSAYLLIPCVAAFVGWFTNYLAVQMIFYPIQYKGLSLWRKQEVPLGLIGWQGIVPCKTKTMSQTMVHMVTTQLLNVEKVFRRLDPNVVADTLAPEVPKLMESIGSDFVPSSFANQFQKLSRALFFTLPGRAISSIACTNRRFLHGLTTSMQDNICSLLNVNNCVIDQMMADRTLLGKLFQKCGQKELDFLTNSGLWFGFLLGIVQMAVALFWENPWALSIGGTIVGLATNWLALKWIFEPVNPTKFGPFVLQGQFLRRQKEVAKEFSEFFANNVLSSKKLWGSILNDPSTSSSFDLLFANRLKKFVYVLAGGAAGVLHPPPGGIFDNIASRAIQKLPNHLHVLHPYVDATLGLQGTLRTQMERMTSAKFERVLHPIFEEDELTLILAGGFLGFLAGLIQQGIETGYLWEWTSKRLEWFRNNNSLMMMKRSGSSSNGATTVEEEKAS
eukprot:CAMPEP_0183709194 /NCGR_PEP_ID=MMETSP0737-20130205/5284_1 /TAXON_ID=385413 /ORGANISM="Thalassiosira miniscula, Strain CCMP1093" /LENGTH=608 /DNA_ID=CAMNT_0025937221 /DNA_START=142 /DNA_END=1968 /DNA_ORIENTATION=+